MAAPSSYANRAGQWPLSVGPTLQSHKSFCLIVRSFDRHETFFPDVQRANPARFINSVRNLRVPPTKSLATENVKISTLFQTTSLLYRQYLGNAITNYRKTENGAANCDHPGVSA